MHPDNFWRRILGKVITGPSSSEQETPTDQFSNKQLIAGDFGYENLILELQDDLEALRETPEFQALTILGKAVFCQYLNAMAKHFGNYIGRHNFLSSSRVESWRHNLYEYYSVCSTGILEQINLFQPVDLVDVQALKCLESLYELFNSDGPQREYYFANVASKDIKGIEILVGSALMTKAKAFDGLKGIHRKLDVTYERLFQHFEKAKNAFYTYAYKFQLIRSKKVIFACAMVLMFLTAWIGVISKLSNEYFLWNIMVFVVNMTSFFLYWPPRVVLFCWLFRQHRHSVALFSNAAETLKKYSVGGHFQSALSCFIGFDCVDAQLFQKEVPQTFTGKMSKNEIKSIREKQKTLSDILEDTISIVSDSCFSASIRFELGIFLLSMLIFSPDASFAERLARIFDEMRVSIDSARGRIKETCSCDSSQAASRSEAYRSELKRMEGSSVVIAAKLNIFVSVCEPEVSRHCSNVEAVVNSDMRKYLVHYLCFFILTLVKYFVFLSSIIPETGLLAALMDIFSRLGLGLFL